MTPQATITTISSCATIDSQPNAANPTTHYIIIRPDLPRGVLAAQVTHAAGESSSGDLQSGTFAVVLQADKARLEQLRLDLTDKGVQHVPIIENGGEYDGELMAIGVAPAPREEVRRHFSSLPLLR